jgi:hypothetical protein
MNCDICQRPHHAKKLPFLCAVDARNRCYEGRVKNLQVLMENDGLQKQINDLLEGPKSGTVSNSKVSVESLVSQRNVAEDRTSQIIAQADRLKADIVAARTEIESRTAAIKHRKSDLASVSSGIASRRTRQQEEIERSTQMHQYLWNRSADQMADTRMFLCAEAAKLYGLRRFKKGASARYEYRIGGIEVVDLASMNSKFCPSATEGLVSTSRLKQSSVGNS